MNRVIVETSRLDCNQVALSESRFVDVGTGRLDCNQVALSDSKFMDVKYQVSQSLAANY